MNKEFIPYEQALELKELGFDDYNIAWYADIDKKPRIVFLNYGGHWKICAPLYQQAFRWFREKHQLHYTIEFKISNNDKYYDATIIGDIKDPEDDDIVYDTYEEAELACLKEMIKIIKNR